MWRVEERHLNEERKGRENRGVIDIVEIKMDLF